MRLQYNGSTPGYEPGNCSSNLYRRSKSPCRSMERRLVSKQLIIVRIYVGVLKFEKHIRYVLPPVKRKAESSNLSSNAYCKVMQKRYLAGLISRSSWFDSQPCNNQRVSYNGKLQVASNHRITVRFCLLAPFSLSVSAYCHKWGLTEDQLVANPYCTIIQPEGILLNSIC